MFCSERSSHNGGGKRGWGGATAIAHRGTERLTESFLSIADAFTPALPHPVVWNGANSQICHQMWQLYSHMVGLAARVLGFPATTLWYFKANAPIKMKEGGNNSPEEVATQTEKDVKLLLPIKTTEVCVIVFFFVFFLLSLQLPFTPSIYRPPAQGLLLFIHPSPLPLPCLITSYSTQILADSPALSPSSTSCLSPLPLLQRVP